MKRRNWWHKEMTESFIGDNIEEDSEKCNFIWTQWRKTDLTDHLKLKNPIKLIYNKLEDNYHLANKKALFMNLSNYYKALGYDPFDVAIPLTFHIKS